MTCLMVWSWIWAAMHLVLLDVKCWRVLSQMFTALLLSTFLTMVSLYSTFDIIMATLWNRAGHYIFMQWFLSTVFSGLQVAPEYKPHPLFLPKIWGKFIDKSHLSISRTLFCYFLACRNVLGCIHVMRISAKERQDAIDVVQKTLHAGLIAWAKVCGDAVIWCQAKTCVTCVGQSPACGRGPELRAHHGTSGARFPTLCRCVQ